MSSSVREVGGGDRGDARKGAPVQIEKRTKVCRCTYEGGIPLTPTENIKREKLKSRTIEGGKRRKEGS